MSELVKKLRNAVIAIAIVGTNGSMAYSYFWADTVRTRVIDTLVKRSGGDDRYLVMTEAGVFENTDCWYRLKFNSSDLQSTLTKTKQTGAEVDLKYYGWRLPLTSSYKNITRVQVVDHPTE